MKTSYIDYAMSVIISRALPDVRDGLKPVHRRILYAMSELNLVASKSYRKSARIVGDTMGKYHPHGDSSIYGAMVRMAQDFSTRYPLVDGHGNFGSVDGDSAAAMRYTEARLAKISMSMLEDIDKNTVDFKPNFDESLKEPEVLPSHFPNLLVNGSSGIAVGMATNIPPHNLAEVVDAVVLMLDNATGNNEEHEERETSIDDLIRLIKGPDFPTGATIHGRYGIDKAYRTGRGKVKVKAVAEIEEMKNGKHKIIVTEIPYQVNKARLIEKIAEHVKDKKIEGITDLRDESDRTGMRIVIELRRDVNPNVVLNQLYKYTQMQETFGINLLALVNKEPKTLNLKQILVHYIDHQKEIVTRRTNFDLEKAQKRAHILEGLRKALDKIDLVIKLIRSSANAQEAKEKLIENIDLSDEQAQAIVDMRLRALTGLEREKIEKEYAELMELIKYLASILESEDVLSNVIREEIIEVKRKYADERRTNIVQDDSDYDIEDLIEEQLDVITITHFGYIKRMALDMYKQQHRGGRGIIGINTIEDDFIENLFVTSSHNYIMFFTNKGKAYRIKAYEISESSRTARGTAIINLLELDQDEKVTAVFPIKEYDEDLFLTMVTKNGMIKKTSLTDFQNIRKGGLIALGLRDEDELMGVYVTKDTDHILLGTRKGKGIMFATSEVRPMGRTAMGVRSIRLLDDEVVGATVPIEGEQILIASEKGLGKRTLVEEFRAQRRGGMGLKIATLTDRTGDIVGITSVHEDEELLLITSEGVIIRINVSQISTLGRYAQGVKLVNVHDGVQVVCIAKVAEDLAEQEEVSLSESEDSLID
ncbi:MAG TPA: DNA gyrase subunit A [Epulopiscium sp.]|nr:DNA gyrase subunit A [Candidatus Epulonipiscium sp.]